MPAPLHTQVRRMDHAVCTVAAAISLAIYYPRVTPVLSLQGDSGVFASAAVGFGVPQPSGYPLYVFLAGLFARLPLGDLAHRVHVFSALCHAAAVYWVARSALRLAELLPASDERPRHPHAGRIVALAAPLGLAFSRGFFQGSLYAEVFPLNDLFTALLIDRALVVWQRGRRSELRGVDLMALALCIGLASAHHQMIALLAPTLAILLWHGRAFAALADRRTLARCLLAFGAPLLFFYGFLFLRARVDPYTNWGDAHSFRAFWRVATRGDYGGVLSPHLAGPELGTSTLVDAWTDTMERDFGWGALAIAGLGAFFGVRGERTRAPAIALVVAVLTAGPVFFVANAIDTSNEHGLAFAARFATMSEVPLALLVALGMASLIERASLVFPEPLLLAASLVLPGFLLFSHASLVDQRDRRIGLAVAHDVLFAGPGTDDDALVLLSGDAMSGAMAWTCGVERRCGRRIVFSPGQMHLGWRVEQLRRRFPALELPTPAGKFITTRELVAANLSRRPVYLSPILLDREPALRSLLVLPQGLLVRVFADEAQAAAHQRELLTNARALLNGPCEGCSITRSQLGAPALDGDLPGLYALAFENHARVVTAYLPEYPGLADELAKKATAIDPVYVQSVRKGAGM